MKVEQVLIFLTAVGLAVGYPYGAPQNDTVCESMTPDHGYPGNNADQSVEVKVEPHQPCYKNDSKIMVTVTIAKEIEGVLAIAREVGAADTTSVGEWIPGKKLRTIDCFGNAKSGLTHSEEPKTYSPIGLVWKPAPGQQSAVKFKVTIVNHKHEFWVGKESLAAITYDASCEDKPYEEPEYTDKDGNPRETTTATATNTTTTTKPPPTTTNPLQTKSSGAVEVTISLATLLLCAVLASFP